MSFATPTTIDITEKTRPLESSEVQLINSCFKPQYQHPVYIWALLAKNSKRKKLFSMLRCEKSSNLLISSRSSETFAYDPEFVIRTSQYTINLNKALAGDQLRKKDPRHYRSQIKETGCLSFENLLQPVSKPAPKRASSSLSSLYARQLFNTTFLAKFSDVADGYTTFLKEIIDYTENKANIYPVSNIKNTSLDPVRESRLISSTFKEDHFMRSKVIVKSTNPTSFGGDLPATTSYADDFATKPMAVSKPMRPLENPHPFSTFPTVEEESHHYTMEDVQAQTRQNQEIGRMNRNVFKSKTVL